MGHQAKTTGKALDGADLICPVAAVAEQIGKLAAALQDAQAGRVSTDDVAVRALWGEREDAIGKRMAVLEEAALALPPRSAAGALFLAAVLKGSLEGDEIDETRAMTLRTIAPPPHVAAGNGEGARASRRLTPEQRKRLALERAIFEAIDLLDEIDAATVDIEDDDPAGTDLDLGESDELERGEAVTHAREDWSWLPDLPARVARARGGRRHG